MTEQVKPAWLEEELTKVMNREIANELLTQREIQITEAESQILLEQCKGNPWDVAIMHQLLEIAKEMKNDANARGADMPDISGDCYSDQESHRSN